MRVFTSSYQAKITVVDGLRYFRDWVVVGNWPQSRPKASVRSEVSQTQTIPEDAFVTVVMVEILLCGYGSRA